MEIIYFSFCMNHEGIWRLSTAYDLTYSVDLTAPVYSNRHSLTVNGKNEDITRKDLETVGLKNDIFDYKALMDSVTDSISKFEEYATALDIDKKLINDIKADFVNL